MDHTVKEMRNEAAEFVPSFMLPTPDTTEESKTDEDDIGNAWYPRAMSCTCC